MQKNNEENKSRKIYVVGGDYGYSRWMQGQVVNNMDEADLVCFTGGQDINPALYGDPCHRTTSYSTHRDAFEVKEFELAKQAGKKMIGICRGAQLLCAMAGGKLVQHSNHPFYHEITTHDGLTLISNSLHHQMANPFNLNKDQYKILAWANNESQFLLNGNGVNLDLPVEPEIVYYPEIKALCPQMHPEMMIGDPDHSDFIGYCQGLLDKFMNDEL